MRSKMETWTYDDITSREFMISQAEHVDACEGKVRLQLTDGDIIVGKRMALINLFFMQVLKVFNIPICKRHWIKRRAFNGGTTAEAWDQYYHEVVTESKLAKPFKMAVWNAMQDLYKFASIRLLPWTTSIDGSDIAQIVSDPKMKEIISKKENFKPELGTDVIEKQIDIGSKAMMKLLETPGALSNEALLPFQRVKQLNKFQVPQTLLAFGIRTDVNDNIIGLPVLGSAVSGIRDIKEYACESLSAKKSQFYSQVAVPGSQYFGRKQHLIASTIQHIYDTDCGSTALVDFNVTEENYNNLIGKNIVLDGKYCTITKQNAREFINTTIHMRSPMTCRYRNGVCAVCGGRIYDNINRKLNLGILSSIQVIEPTTQKILSSKHLIKTNTILYQVPKLTDKIFVRTNTKDIRWRVETYAHLPKLEMGIPLKYFASIHDVKNIRKDRPISEERFSQVYDFFLRQHGSDSKPIRVELMSNGQVPFLSSDMILFIQDHWHDLIFDDQIVWIPMKGTEKLVLFRNTVINDNMFLFVKSVDKFLSSDIKEFTTCSSALEKFSSIIYSKVIANIVHLETLLKAYEIISQQDYRIPLVTDPNNVLFQTTASILNNRHIGTKLGYQGLKQYICHPSTYLTLRQESPFDWMIIK